MASGDATVPVKARGRPRRSRWPFRRVWAAALITFRQGMRSRLWLMIPLAIVVLIVADVSSRRFDLVFEGIPAAVGMTLLVMAVLAALVGVCFATYSFPAEVDAKIASTVAVKPIGRGELVAAKTVGMSVLLLVMLATVGAGAYVYMLIRSVHIQSLARDRLAEARTRATHGADLNALEAVATRGPMQTYRYRSTDAGPDIRIHHAEGTAQESDADWILGGTGMRLRWDLDQTPLREWVASGPCQLRLNLELRPATDAPDQTTDLFVEFVGEATRRPRRDLMEAPAPRPQYTRTVKAPASGRVVIPLFPAGVPAGDAALNVPLEGAFAFQVRVRRPGCLARARERALRIVGPGGQAFHLSEAPEVAPGLLRGRGALAGGSELPRQVGVFRFDDVPPAILGEGDVAVEAQFLLDAWSPGIVETTAEITFVEPESGNERSVVFAPESYRPTVLYIDRAFWHGGPLEVRIECLTDEDFLGMLPESVRLRLGGGSFAWNLAKAGLQVWLFGTSVAAAGILLSTRLTWFVSILGAFAFLTLGMFRDFILTSTPVGEAARRLSDRLADWTGRLGWDRLAEHVVLPLPDLRALLPGEQVNTGQVLGLADLGSAFGWAAITVFVMVLIGGVLLKKREVAA